MSAATVSTAVGEDGIDIAAQALKDIAADQHAPEQVRVTAATTLLQYGLSYVDSFGNEARG